MKKVCVIGGGIIGTTSAYQIKKKFPHLQIDVISELFSPDTLSDGPAGIVLPFLDPNTPQEKTIKWTDSTRRLCERLWNNPHSDPDLKDLAKSIYLTPFTQFYDEKNEWVGTPFWTFLVSDFHHLPEKDVATSFGQTNKKAVSMTTYTLEPALALKALYKVLQLMGVRFIQKKVERLEELAHYDLIVNCCGAGARSLTNDDKIQPISGHVLRAKAPWIKSSMMSYYGDHCAYMLVNNDTVVLGSINTANNWSTAPRSGDREKILAGVCEICPRLKDAEIVAEWIGLRPFRTKGVRLELENIERPGKQKIRVIHNYGHGGSGITLAWGCAEEVVEIMEKLNFEVSSKL